ncbi:AimR family lysis-lysogeny pheromone receptor [Rossellomorea marisflavi]|uniref:AimR family lysis-lysogeny pheromone receptor n=1 Tax=Rossellomorea marisflavi TaxID=189381 RepID=UPI003F9FC926
MGRLSLQQMILNEFEADNGLATRMAKLVGYSSPGALGKILKDEKKEFAKFYSLVKIVREIFPEDDKSLMAEHSKTLDPNKQTARYMLEYLELNKLQNHKAELIERMLQGSNAVSKEWATVYKIDHDYATGKVNLTDTIKKFLVQNTKTLECSIINELFLAYCYLETSSHSLIQPMMATIEEKILQVQDDYIREMLYSRYALIFISTKVREDKLKEARAMCETVINNIEDTYFTAWAYLHLGNSYIVSSKDKALFYLKSGYEITKDERFKHVHTNIKRSINFTCNLYKETPELLDLKSTDTSDQHEIAFYYIQHGQKTNALKVLDSLNLEQMSDNQKGFHFYYRGLLGNDKKVITESIKYFKKSGDIYFRKLPLLELSKSGVDDYILEALAL